MFSSRKSLIIALCFVVLPLMQTEQSHAQIRYRLRNAAKNLLSGNRIFNSQTKNYPNGYAIGQPSGANGYVPPVISVGRNQPNVVDGTPADPYQLYRGVEGFSQRIRVVNPDGTYSVRYYDQQGNMIGGNWAGQTERREVVQSWNAQKRRPWGKPRRLTTDSSVASSGFRSRNWFQRPGLMKRSSSGSGPIRKTLSSIASMGSSGGTGSSSGGANIQSMMGIYNQLMARSNAQLQQVRRRGYSGSSGGSNSYGRSGSTQTMSIDEYAGGGSRLAGKGN